MAPIFMTTEIKQMKIKDGIIVLAGVSRWNETYFKTPYILFPSNLSHFQLSSRHPFHISKICKTSPYFSSITDKTIVLAECSRFSFLFPSA